MKREKNSYEQVLGDIAAYIATEYDFTASEAVGIVMNSDTSSEIIKELHSSWVSIDVPGLASKIMQDAPIE